MSVNKKNYIFNTVSVKLGCSSSSCAGPTLTSLFSRRPTHRHRRRRRSSHIHNSSSSSTTFSSSTAVDTPPLCYSSDTESDIKSLRAVQGFGRLGGESLAVEKDSDDPYLDFRRSMLQMIMEKELYSRDDLKELLNCFLQLNSPYYHAVIVRAFADIWNGVTPAYGMWISGDF